MTDKKWAVGVYIEGGASPYNLKRLCFWTY